MTTFIRRYPEEKIIYYSCFIDENSNETYKKIKEKN